ncbi:phenylacetate--CoA ligase family protein [Thalassotalea crassostreae]|uniref:phenylacetate--CoA ligase family protein n=1 Tax=Thalassotalea crassostreae TaxID=1763536 RepID=UPI000A77AA92|nr:phenylacetate--CoA ligase family protein [Thalassotalea crassostreae]
MKNIYGIIFNRFLFPFYCKVVKSTPLLDEYQSAEKRLTWSKKELEYYQWKQLTRLLKHCWNNIPYYKNLWLKHGITNIDEIKSMEDFNALPVLTKNDVTNHFSQLVYNTSNKANIKKSTGGSTGQPFHFELDYLSNEKRQAIMWRGYNWLGAGLGAKALFLWGTGVGEESLLRKWKEQLYHRFYNRKILNTFTMCDKNMMGYIDEINQYQPEALVCYTTPVYELARYIIREKITVHSPKSILTGAEALLDFQKETIEKAFKAPVYNTYGCREFMLIAAVCKENNSLHINSDHLLVETINHDGKRIQNDIGDIVITDLSNYGMPLIRYVTGDTGSLTDKPCACANPLPVLKKISGRKLDIIKCPSGNIIPGELFPHLLKEVKSILKFQVIQKTIDSITINLVVSAKFNDNDKTFIENEIHKYDDNQLTIHFNFVNSIPLTVSGKHRVTICEI